MVQRIDNQKVEMEIEIVPKLRYPKEISLNPGDTLVAKVDQDMWDIEDAQRFYEILEKAFPNNQILVLFKGVELEVIKNEL